MTKHQVNTLILDLDNTVFDWFAVWYASFRPVYDALLAATPLPPSELEQAIRHVHQERRTSEYTFLLEDLEPLREMREKGEIREQFKGALDESRRERDRNLKLYPAVFRCLWEIKKRGTKIIAYTESMAFYSAYRLKRFGLDGVIDVLFSPQDHGIPKGVPLSRVRHLPDDFYELQVTELRHTPAGELKPNPRVLLDIIEAVGADVKTCAYVGDSLFKDVAMARDVGVFDIHAKYGESQRRPEYSLLQRVSHWTEEDVQREAAITAKGHPFEPSAVLTDSFAEIFIHCDFDAFAEPAKPITEQDEIDNALEVWKKSVDVQQHFNDLEMRTRNFAITSLGVLIAAIGFTYQQGLETTLFGIKFASGLGIVVAAAFSWTGFFLMDRFWYHVLLKGAVKHAGKIEKRYKDIIPEIGLGQTITEVSGEVKILGRTMNSDARLTWFYLSGYGVLGLVFLSLLFAVSHKQAPAVTEVPVIESSQQMSSEEAVPER